MRILVIDGHALAGGMIFQYLSERTQHELFFTSQEKERRPNSLYLDAKDPVMVEKLVEVIRPHIIINSIGLINDLARQQEIDAYRINGLLPQQLADLADRQKSRLIHLSTDSVFLGDRGFYEERHVPDGNTVYAKTRSLGEVRRAPHLTIRTSLLGPDPDCSCCGLLSWFLRQRGTVKGFVRVPWNGITTLELAKFVHDVIDRPKVMSGIVHLASEEKINKYELLELLRTIFHKEDVVIQPDDAIALNRTLKSTREDLDYVIPRHHQMLSELYQWMASHGSS